MFEESIVVRVPVSGSKADGSMRGMGALLPPIGDGETAMMFADGISVSVEKLDDVQRKQRQAEPGVAVGTAMPIRLIKPIVDDNLHPESEHLWGLEAVGATKTRWTGEGIRVAILDTGIDRSHDAFAGLPLNDDNVADFTDEGIDDVDGHGTHCAGTVFGRPVNGVRIGVAQGINDVLIGKVLGEQSSTSAMLFRALEWAIDRRANVISMSLGFDFPAMVANLTKNGWPLDLAVSKTLLAFRGNLEVLNVIMLKIEALARAGTDIAGYGGTLVVAATGNESRADEDQDFRIGASLPSASAGVCSVGALASDGAGKFTIAPFSNGGATFCAPGVNIVSAKAGGGLVAMSGTSMAAPHAAGVAALWAQRMLTEGSLNIPSAVQGRMSAFADRSRIVGADPFACGDGLIVAP